MKKKNVQKRQKRVKKWKPSVKWKLRIKVNEEPEEVWTVIGLRWGTTFMLSLLGWKNNEDIPVGGQ